MTDKKIPNLCINCNDNKNCEWIVEQTSKIDYISDFGAYMDARDSKGTLVTVNRGFRFEPSDVLEFKNINLLVNKKTGNCAKKDGLDGVYLRLVYFEPFAKAENAVAQKLLKQLRLKKNSSDSVNGSEKQIKAIKSKRAGIKAHLDGLKIRTL